MMMKYKGVCWFVTAAALIGLAVAQNAAVGASAKSGAKSGTDPVQSSIKPLTPKSAMPAPRKSPVVAPNASHGGGGGSNAELTRLERQNINAGTPKSGSSVPVKGSSKSAGASATKGPGINFNYQKPAGGTQASTPGANSPNSSTPRVTKKN